MRIVRIAAAALLLTSSIAATPAFADNKPATGSTDHAKKLTANDRKFILTAYDHESEELAIGRLATQQGYSEQVKMIGSQIVSEETAAMAKLQDVAKNNDFTLPDKPSAGTMSALPTLQKLTGRKFDDAFLSHVKTRDEVALGSFQNAAKVAKNDDVKSFASGEVPVIKGQLDQVKTGSAELQKQNPGETRQR
jgi:putative membrane protein